MSQVTVNTMRNQLSAEYSCFDTNKIRTTEHLQRDREALLAQEIRALTSDGRDYVVLTDGWQKIETDFSVRMVKTVGVFLRDFNQAEFEGDVVFAPHLEHVCWDSDYIHPPNTFKAINKKRTLWRLIGGKNDLRDAKVNPETTINSGIQSIDLPLSLMSSPDFFINQVLRAVDTMQRNSSGLLYPNRMWLPREAFYWSQSMPAHTASLDNVQKYLAKSWLVPLAISQKAQLCDVAVLFVDDREKGGYKQKPTVVKFPDRTTWLHSQNKDEVLQPNGAIVLRW